MKNFLYKLLGKKLYYDIKYYPMRVWHYKSFSPRVHRAGKHKKYRLKFGRSVLNSRAKVELIAQRDGKHCKYCGATEHLTIDHFIPKALFPKDAKNNNLWKQIVNTPKNWVIACENCNMRKGSKIY